MHSRQVAKIYRAILQFSENVTEELQAAACLFVSNKVGITAKLLVNSCFEFRLLHTQGISKKGRLNGGGRSL